MGPKHTRLDTRSPTLPRQAPGALRWGAGEPAPILPAPRATEAGEDAQRREDLVHECKTGSDALVALPFRRPAP
ncbi:hypothetical protein SBBP1_50003 [Burkholderiales bacterium]|nr:hypothetical protein SBBP1_50003 [Burkholderiales bacterium]